MTLGNLVCGRTYLVTAVGAAGYEQTLQARFTVSDKEENVYMNVAVSGGNFALLTVWTENVKGNLEVAYTADGLIPDATDPILRDIMNWDRNGEKYINFSFYDSENFMTPYAYNTYRFFLSEGVVVDSAKLSVFIVSEGKTYIGSLADLPS